MGYEYFPSTKKIREIREICLIPAYRQAGLPAAGRRDSRSNWRTFAKCAHLFSFLISNLKFAQ
jgi:hypothetical protein